MKIIIFSTAYYPYIGGAEVAVKEITDRIVSAEFEMITVRLKKSDAREEQIGKIKVYRLGFGLGRIDKFLFPFRAANLANKLHKEKKYDIIWSIMASFSGFAALFFKKKNLDVKFLLTLQEGDDLGKIERKVWLARFWFKQIFTKADYIQCISNYLAQWARKMGAVCPVEVVPNGANFQFSIFNFQTIPNDTIFNFKKQLGITNNEKVILTTSRLVKKNGLADLVEAVALCVMRYALCVTLVICGTGVELNNLKSKIKNLKLENRVKFVGFVPLLELSGYYAAADVFCRPSLSEGLGNSFLEAMAAEVPVVATPVGGIPDFLEDGKTGWFCKVRDPQSIAEKIQYILDEKNKDEVEWVVKNAKELVEKKYNWDNIAIQMNNIFNKLTN